MESELIRAARPKMLDATQARARRSPAPPQRQAAMALNWCDALRQIEQELPFTRRTVQPGEMVQRAGDAFSALRIVNSGVFRVMSSAHGSLDGSDRVISIQFKGGWIGFDGMATGHYTCDAVAMDVGQLWTLAYATLLTTAARMPALMHTVHVAMSGQMEYERNWLLAMGALQAESRVALLLCEWARALAARAMRIDPIMLRMSRTEMASYLCMTQETLSRAFSRFKASGLIQIDDTRRNAIMIPDLQALAEVANSRPTMSGFGSKHN